MTPAEAKIAVASLPRQERNVLLHLSRGLIDRDIATEMGISAHTVNEYMKKAFHRLGVNKRPQAAVIATLAEMAGSNSADDPAADLGKLTPRESEVLRLYVKGFNTAEIVGLLGIADRTVEAHRAGITSALECTFEEACAMAGQAGWR